MGAGSPTISTMGYEATFIQSLSSIRASDGAVAGGKGANLGELIAAGFPVPDGFVVTTAAYVLAAQAASVDPADPLAAAERLRTSEMPAPIAATALEAYRALGGGPVAVRSSATAEDLPGASFAGQQDTYLNVAGENALIDAIRRCWASLWNERAVAYRHANGIDDQDVALAVVVQRMVDARSAGVLFTADPITGRRGRAVIDAAPGLGEAVVSGAVDPDHFAVDARTGEIVERRIRGDAAVLDDGQVRELDSLGTRIEQLFGAPQDIEFAVDVDERIWIVQSRPITTLYPLPAGLPDPDVDLRVFFSGNVFQGYFEPITPMGIEPFLALGGTVMKAFAAAGRDGGGRPPVVEAGMRVYLDVTPILRDAVGRIAIQRATAIGEARSSVIMSRLASDPRVAPPCASRIRSARRLVPLLVRSGIPMLVLRVLRSPATVPIRYVREIEAATRIDLPPDATAAARVDAFERLMRSGPPRVFPRLVSLVIAGMMSYVGAARLLGDRARDDELQRLTRGLAHNPTTEMDLALWSLATEIRDDVASRDAVLQRTPADLAAAYAAGTLPPPAQAGLSAFLARYGFRSVGEIDLGVPRWAEDPAHLLGAIANYLRLEDDALAPDAQFARGAREADAMVATLLGRVRGPRRLLLRFFLRRLRALMGLREAPKFHLIRRIWTPLRNLLRPVGDELASAGRIASADDVFFLTLAEARAAIAGEDLHQVVAERRAMYVRERARRHIPRVLLSDGTDAEIALVPVSTDADALRGTPASPGIVTGTARVIMSPLGARLEPGEILVAPSTDPGWTPLFLTAGGLVMEMGGMMSHGAVVAREYGIPAVVGVAGATERITTGQLVTVDGSAGAVSLEDA
jgi:phosphohistidine swiveling domain-containing protein